MDEFNILIPRMKDKGLALHALNRKPQLNFFQGAPREQFNGVKMAEAEMTEDRNAWG
jgi:hypothetical protein